LGSFTPDNAERPEGLSGSTGLPDEPSGRWNAERPEGLNGATGLSDEPSGRCIKQLSNHNIFVIGELQFQFRMRVL